MQTNKEEKKKKSIFHKLFGTPPDDLDVQSAVGVGAETSTENIGDISQWIQSITGQDKKLMTELPRQRMGKYWYFDQMSRDPLIHAALQLHVNNACAYSEEIQGVFQIESKTQGDDKIVSELREIADKFLLQERMHEWAYGILKYGNWYIRPYGKEKEGLTGLRSDAFTHPSTVRSYEVAGKTVGYTSRYQQQTKEVQLMQNWEMIEMKMLLNTVDADFVPVTNNAMLMDISLSEPQTILTETQNYGVSILEAAYQPYTDLWEAIVSLNISRRNKSRRERAIAYPFGGMNPVKASQFIQMIADKLKQRKVMDYEKRLSKGYVPTTDDLLLPYASDGKGRLEFNVIDPNVNIDAIEDLMFHVKRVCSALSIDPSLVGFGDMLSGGLGEGGWFRLSLNAASTGEQLRRSLRQGLNRLFDIHIAYKYNKVFSAEDRVWRIKFNAASSAKENEEKSNLLMSLDVAERLTGLLANFGAEEGGGGIEKDGFALANYILTDVLKLDEERVNTIIKKSTAKPKTEKEDD